MTIGNNLLVLSAGRRVELVTEFMEALKWHFPRGRVFAVDTRPELSAACRMADKWFAAPHVSSEGYIDFLRQACIEHKVGLVIPTIDTELLLLAEHKQDFRDLGVELSISDYDLVRQCRDKRETARLFEKLGIDSPLIYDPENIQFPCFCKPYDGSSSIGASVLYSSEMLTQNLQRNKKNIFMELVGKEYAEYTIDCYYDNSSLLRCLVPRKRLEVRAGEVSKGVTRKNKLYDSMLSKLSEMPGAAGCLTIQVFYNEVTDTIKGLEINPRFGGGFPLSHAAGANFPEWLIREHMLGENIPFFDKWESDLLMLRYDAKVMVHDSD